MSEPFVEGHGYGMLDHAEWFAAVPDEESPRARHPIIHHRARLGPVRRAAPAPSNSHPLDFHRPRIADRLVFDKLVQVLIFGCTYWRIADATCSASTLRRRRDEWIAAGVMDQLATVVEAAYDRMIGLDLQDLAVDGCITEAPCGGEEASRSPVDRGKQGHKRSMVVEGLRSWSGAPSDEPR